MADSIPNDDLVALTAGILNIFPGVIDISGNILGMPIDQIQTATASDVTAPPDLQQLYVQIISQSVSKWI